MLAVDISNYTGALTDGMIDDALSYGVEKWIVGLQYPTSHQYPPGVAHQQIQKLVDRGIRNIDVYCMSQHVADVWHRVAHLAQYIGTVWIDVEENYATRQWIDEHINFIEAQGKRPGIYTAAWFWNSQEYRHWFGDRPVWVADYDFNANLNIREAVGDWGYSCEMKQYHGETELGRLKKIDLNYQEAVRVPVPQQLPQNPQLPATYGTSYPAMLSVGADIDKLVSAFVESLANGRTALMYVDELGRPVYSIVLRL